MAENGAAAAAAASRGRGGCKPSLYERIKHDTEHDPKALQEVALGKRVGFYKLRTQLGSGNFATVKLGMHLLTNEKVAVKIIDKTKLDDQARRLLSREITCMECLQHRNLVRLFEVIDTFPRLYLVMECAAAGDLQARIASKGAYTEEQARLIFAQLVAAISHMHERGVIHRDLKSENIFFHSETEIKVGDFGFSTETTGRLLDTFCGSPPYAAPELFSEECYKGPLVDVWAMGIILYLMLSARMPFHADNVSLLKQKILAGKFEPLSARTPACQELLAKILTKEPEQRYTVNDITSSSWLQAGSTDQAVISGPDEGGSPAVAVSLKPEECVDQEVLNDLEGIGVPTADTQAFIGEPRSAVAGVYRILLHRKHTAALSPQPGHTPRSAVEPANQTAGAEVLTSGQRGTEQRQVWTERKAVSSKRSKFCTVL